MSGTVTERPARLRAGVVGFGWAGQQHMDAYALHPDVELVAIAGLEDGPRATLGERYGLPEAGLFRGYQEMIDAARLDVISIATPTALHAPVALAALAAGVHVLSEKPLAESVDRASAMVGAAKAADRVLDVSFNHRRRGDVKMLKQVIDDGLLGEIYYAKAGWLRRSGIPGLGTWFTQKSLAGGGPMMDIGVHMLDMALHLMGEPTAEAVSAATYAEFGPRGRGGSSGAKVGARADGTGAYEVEDLSTAFVRLSGGATLLLEASWASYIERDQLYVVLYGSEGGAVLGSPEAWNLPQLSVLTELKGFPAELTPVLPADGNHAEAVDDFVAKVRSSSWADQHGEHLLTRSTIVEAAYRSAEQHREVVIDQP
ncbi:Gfo/Idh/MocA family protein [Microlunatus antarcticus]|uniref:Putative dehydrogenase n=1 Tax=Microlunatus antarcticus TaxID=53388 RepID=A0A7W5JVF2_9ACTN|nr:Gfo/Idh/MocA family oxidoreductase [Microlunatus antarcticus]MBB3326507.1 putative dehydrogenase [Microlunatus antarcticus]